MIHGIEKHCTNESIIYSLVDNKRVKKSYYDNNGKKKKEKFLNVASTRIHNRYYRDSEQFLEDMIWNNGYAKIN